MTNIEKVIKGLQAHADGCGYRSHHCDAMDCPYRYGDESCDIEEMCRDALELLKEQDAVEPKTEPSAKGYWYTCGSCGWWLFQVCDTVHFEDRKRIRFCSSCGQAVKWE